MNQSAYTNYFKITCNSLPNTTKRVKSVTLPGMSIPKIDTQYSTGSVALPSDKITFDPITIDFIIDEKFESWKEIYDWMMAMSSPTDIPGRKPIYDDIQVTLLTASYNPLYTIKFVDCFPSLLSPIPVNYGSNDTLIGNVTFEYSYSVIQ